MRVLTHAFLDGPEYRSRPTTWPEHVSALYRAILGRDPEFLGLIGWVQVLRGHWNGVLARFIGSPEFRALLPDCRDPDAVTALILRLFAEALGRPPAPDQLDGWQQAFLSSCEIELSVRAFFEVWGYHDVPRTLAEHITILYRALLGRTPAPQELGPWVDHLAASFIADQLVDSAEFAARRSQLGP